jgi:hypothetical protein
MRSKWWAWLLIGAAVGFGAALAGGLRYRLERATMAQIPVWTRFDRLTGRVQWAMLPNPQWQTIETDPYDKVSSRQLSP